MNDALNKGTIRGHEGDRLIAYHDTRGVLTAGVGFNLDDAAAETICAAAGADYLGLRAGLPMSQAQSDAIFEAQYEAVAYAARKIFPAIDTYPENAAAVICDMLFELGTAGFLKFRHTVIAFGLKDWPGAIAGIKDSALAGQVPERVKQNVALLEAI